MNNKQPFPTLIVCAHEKGLEKWILLDLLRVVVDFCLLLDDVVQVLDLDVDEPLCARRRIVVCVCVCAAAQCCVCVFARVRRRNVVCVCVFARP